MIFKILDVPRLRGADSLEAKLIITQATVMIAACAHGVTAAPRSEIVG